MSKSQNWTFFQLFHSHKIHLLAFSGLSTVTEMADSATLSYTSTIYIPSHPYLYIYLFISLAIYLDLVPERPISTNPGLKFCSVFVVYLPK